jgi:hypothetical protein
MPDYANIYIEGHSLHEMSCSYKRKKVVVAGLLEFFLPFGLGHFYSGHYTVGILKFIYNFFIYSFCCILFCKGSSYDPLMNMMLLCIVLCLVIPIWNMVDLIMFLSGNYLDGSGVPMS